MSEFPALHDACETIREALPAAALDALPDGEMQQVMAHVDRCEPCRGELTTLSRMALQLTYAAPLEPVDVIRRDGLRARLHARALREAPVVDTASSRDSGRARDGVTPIRADRRTLQWVALAALAASIVIAVGLARDRRDLSRDLDQERSRQSLELASLRSELSVRDTLLAALTGPSVRVISLSAPALRPAGALMFWNRETSQWTFVAHDLPLLDAGRTYQLWVVLGSTPTSVSTFVPDALGNARVSARLSVDANAHPQIAITNEPAGGSPRPTTEPLIVSARSR